MIHLHRWLRFDDMSGFFDYRKCATCGRREFRTAGQPWWFNLTRNQWSWDPIR